MTMQVAVMNVGVNSKKSKVKTTKSTNSKSFVDWMSFWVLVTVVDTYDIVVKCIYLFIMSECSFVAINPRYLASIYQLRKMSMEKR